MQNSAKQRTTKIFFTICFFTLCFLFAFLAYSVTHHQTDAIDQSAAAFISSHSTSQLIQVMKVITFFGSTKFLLPAYILLVLYFLTRKKFHYALYISASASGGAGLIYLLKNIFQRKRPGSPILQGITGYSFPSGHAFSSFVFYSIAIYLLWKGNFDNRWKYAATLLFLIYPLSVALSRIVLNVHYVTDVLAGILLAIIWLILCFAIISKTASSGHLSS